MPPRPTPPRARRHPTRAAALLATAFLATAFLATACGSQPGEPVGPANAAIATPSCGPTDGPAVQVVVAAAIFPVARPMPPYVSVNIARPVDALAGQTFAAGDGALVAAARQPDGGAIEYDGRGTVRVTGVGRDTTVTGTLDLRFPSGARVRQTFRARWVPAPPGPRCG